VPFFTEKTILDNIIQNLRNSRMNYLARKPIINFDLYSTPFSRIREEKVSGSTKRDRPASVFRKKAMPGFDDSTYKE
jgi:hypothetical protein